MTNCGKTIRVGHNSMIIIHSEQYLNRSLKKYWSEYRSCFQHKTCECQSASYSDLSGTQIHPVLQSTRYSNLPGTPIRPTQTYPVLQSIVYPVHWVLKSTGYSNMPAVPVHQVLNQIHLLLQSIRYSDSSDVSMHWVFQSIGHSGPLQSSPAGSLKSTGYSSSHGHKEKKKKKDG